MQKVIERILNLLAFLLTAGRPVTADEIRMTVAGYDRSSDEAWRRMFERDKELLRQLGIPLELRPTDAWEVEHGYVVPADSYALPDPGLTDEERAALWLAAQVVRIGGQAPGPEALFKLGGSPMTVGGEPLAANLGASSELEAAFTATADRRMLSFDYKGTRRTIRPYGLVHRRGHWYVAGVEVSAPDTIKAFRLERASAAVAGDTVGAFDRPAGFRAADAIPAAPWEAGGEDLEATVVFDAAIAWWARRQITGSSDVVEHTDGSLSATLRVANPDAFIGWMIGFEDQAEILAPVALREAFLTRVEGAE